MLMDFAPRTQFSVDPMQAGTSVVRVAGELTAATGPRLRRVLDRAAARGQVRLLVDLANVCAFDVEGIEVLRAARDRLDRRGVQLVVAGLAGHRRALPGRIRTALDGLETVGDLEDAVTGTR
jgi:anti-anti-sigma factor